MSGRLFLLYRTPLAELDDASQGPSAGDTVTWFRHLQDPYGDAAADLAARGVRVVWGEATLDADDDDAIDRFTSDACAGWYLDDRSADCSVCGGASLARLLAPELHRAYQLGYLVRMGEMIRRQLESLDAPPGEVLTDFVDGVFPYVDAREVRAAVPVRSLLADLCAARQTPLRDWQPADPVPPNSVSGSVLSWGAYARNVALFGWRMPLRAWARWLLRCRDAARVYFVLGRDLQRVAETLGRRDGIAVLADGGVQFGPLRPDLMPVLPGPATLRAGLRLRRHARQARPGAVNVFRGVDHSRWIGAMVHHLTGTPMWLASLRLAQWRLLFRVLRPQLVVAAGEEPPYYQGALQAAHARGASAVIMDHGYVTAAYSLPSLSRHDRSLEYVVQSAAVAGVYGRAATPGHGPRVKPISLPCSQAMMDIRRDPDAPGPALLIANHDPVVTMSTRRVRSADAYLLDVLALARELHAQGVRVTYRPHPGEDRAPVLDAFRRARVDGCVTLDTVPAFSDSLARHDVLVCNASTVLYQALYGGWPTVFYEPWLRREDFVGLPASADAEAPVAGSPARLAELVRDALAGGRVANYASEFASRHAAAFIGEDPARADVLLADHLSQRLRELLPARQAAGALAPLDGDR